MLRYKAIPDAVNGSFFGETIISKYKGVIHDFTNKKLNILPSLFCVVSVYAEQSPPIMAQSKIFFTKP
jgi:hypothetical protein